MRTRVRARSPLLALALWGGTMGAASCGPRATTAPRIVQLAPPPPAPPGSKVVWGPLRIESVTPVRSSVGWTQELARGERTVSWDVVLVQDRATCPDAVADAALVVDEEQCRGVAAVPAACKGGPPLRARVEVTTTWSIDLAHRCRGSETPWDVTSDPRAEITKQGVACFRAKNMLKPETAWTSLYELTELRIGEVLGDARSTFPRALGRLLAGDGARFCRDDGAYLDGAPGRPQPTLDKGDNSDARALAAALLSRAPFGTDAAPLTSGSFRDEHALWEACNANGAKADVVAQERCLLLRDLDRFLREVEDLARPQTPKGAATPAASGATP